MIVANLKEEREHAFVTAPRVRDPQTNINCVRSAPAAESGRGTSARCKGPPINRFAGREQVMASITVGVRLASKSSCRTLRNGGTMDGPLFPPLIAPRLSGPDHLAGREDVRHAI